MSDVPLQPSDSGLTRENVPLLLGKQPPEEMASTVPRGSKRFRRGVGWSCPSHLQAVNWPETENTQPRICTEHVQTSSLVIIP